jgi:hypothetical protein
MGRTVEGGRRLAVDEGLGVRHEVEEWDALLTELIDADDA